MKYISRVEPKKRTAVPSSCIRSSKIFEEQPEKIGKDYLKKAFVDSVIIKVLTHFNKSC